MRTKRKRILCTTNTLDILQEHEIFNYISVPAGTTLMTVTFSEEDLEKLKLEGILNGINYGIANYQTVGLAHVRFVFVLPFDLGHGQALKRQRHSLHPRHTNSSERIQFSGFKSSNLGFGIKTTPMHSLCILQHPENLAPTIREQRRSLINNAFTVYFETPRKPSANN